MKATAFKPRALQSNKDNTESDESERSKSLEELNAKLLDIWNDKETEWRDMGTQKMQEGLGKGLGHGVNLESWEIAEKINQARWERRNALEKYKARIAMKRAEKRLDESVNQPAGDDESAELGGRVEAMRWRRRLESAESKS